MRILFLSLIFICGCQVSQKKEQEQLCFGIRQPAAYRCETIYSKSLVVANADNSSSSKVLERPSVKTEIHEIKVPSPVAMKTVFDQLSDYGPGGAPWAIIKAAEFAYTHNVGNRQKPVFLGQLLSERRARGESTARIMTEVGFREQSGYLMPPRNIPGLYSKLFQKLQASAIAAGIKESDIIWPALLFVKDNRDLVFVRPGIDPLPPKNQGWRLHQSDNELQIKDFHRMISEGKMVFSPAMFYHDINHIIDFIERPHYMPAFRNFVTETYKLSSAPPMSLRDTQRLYGNAGAALKSDPLLNEFIRLARPSERSSIEKIFPDLGNKRLEDLPELTEKLMADDQYRLLAKADEILKKQDKIFYRHGGGIRDFFIERYREDDRILKGIEELINGNSRYARESENGTAAGQQFAYVQNEVSGMLQRLEIISQYVSNPQASTQGIRFLVIGKAKENSIDPQEYARMLLAMQLAEINRHIKATLLFEITPERMMTDLTLLTKKNGWKQYLKSPTYKFYSIYRHGSFQWKAFVDIEPREVNY